MCQFKLYVSAITYFLLLAVVSGSPVSAADCGILRLQKERSTGAEIVVNKCQDAENLGLESIVKLRSNSRVWLESISDYTNSPKFQLICLNKSSESVNIKLANAFLPWVKPEGAINCYAWINERLECKESTSDQIALICAIALKRMFVVNHEIHKNASVIMRGTDLKEKRNTLTDRELAILESLIKNDLNRKFSLCESLFDRDVTIAWTIRASGQVANVSVAETADIDPFGNCAIEVIKMHAFPSFSKDIQVSTSFN
jgi:hypothetical protein